MTTTSKLDLYDFLLLKEIRAARSITGAVPQVGLSQPAISVRLGHLRQHFGDPLFVRTSSGFMSTPFLESLMDDIEQVLKLLSPEENARRVFEPGTSNRRFRLGLSHIAQMVMLPEVVRQVKALGPGLQIDSIDLDASTAGLLESGQLDLAIGYTVELHNGFFQQRLFAENYSCIVRKAHPRIGSTMSQQQFLEEEHLALVAPATGHSLLDKVLEERGVQRNVTARVSSYLGLEQILVSTDLVAMVPSRLARTLAHGERIKILGLPFPSPTYEVRQYWHERYHHDSGNSWLRKLIFDCFTNLPPVFTALLSSTTRLR